MELRQLRYFVSVADLGNFTRAAAILHVAQSALSRQIKKLEDELGAILLYRDGRSATVTEAGRRFYDHAKRVLRQIDDARRELAEERQTPTGSVAFGYPHHLGPEFPASLMGGFRARYPKARLRLVEAFSNQLADWLFTGRLDAALFYNAESVKHAVPQLTVAETLYAVARPGDPLTASDRVAFAALAGLPLITPDPPSITRNRIEEAMVKCGITMRFELDVDSMPVIKRLVAQGHGYAIMPFAAIHEEIAAGTLSAARVVEPELRMNLSLALPRHGGPSVLTGLLTALVREEIERAIDAGLWRAQVLRTEAAPAG